MHSSTLAWPPAHRCCVICGTQRGWNRRPTHKIHIPVRPRKRKNPKRRSRKKRSSRSLYRRGAETQRKALTTDKTKIKKDKILFHLCFIRGFVFNQKLETRNCSFTFHRSSGRRRPRAEPS